MPIDSTTGEVALHMLGSIPWMIIMGRSHYFNLIHRPIGKTEGFQKPLEDSDLTDGFGTSFGR